MNLTSKTQAMEALNIVARVCNTNEDGCINCPYWLDISPEVKYCMVDRITDSVCDDDF